MSLKRLEVQSIRNIEPVAVNLEPGINLIAGDNGSGKTSILESIYFLSSARSFRNTGVDPLIHWDKSSCQAKGVLSSGLELSVRRDRQGVKILHVSGDQVKRTSELAQCLPVLILGPDTVNLLLGGPDLRRRFMNWGVFHVEQFPGQMQVFSSLWESALRSLRQRNEALRKPQPDSSEINVWSREFVRYSEAIDERRSNYMVPFTMKYLENCNEFMQLDDISLEYKRGWEGDLEVTLANEIHQDIKRGYTNKGFQRADVRIRVNGNDVAKVCSRGELKVLAWSLIISQGDLLDTDPIYLVDDVMSELDENHRYRICRHLEECGKQIIATGIDSDALAACWNVEKPAMFHVKQGVLDSRGQGEQ